MDTDPMDTTAALQQLADEFRRQESGANVVHPNQFTIGQALAHNSKGSNNIKSTRETMHENRPTAAHLGSQQNVHFPNSSMALNPPANRSSIPAIPIQLHNHPPVVANNLPVPKLTTNRTTPAPTTTMASSSKSKFSDFSIDSILPCPNSTAPASSRANTPTGVFVPIKTMDQPMQNNIVHFKYRCPMNGCTLSFINW